MASSVRTLRPRRGAAAAPNLAESIARINALTSKYNEGVRTEFLAVAKAFKDDADGQINFWLSDTSLLNVADFRHAYLLRYLFETCGSNDPTAIAYLDTLADVTPIGLVRETYRGGGTRYRIRVGMDA